MYVIASELHKNARHDLKLSHVSLLSERFQITCVFIGVQAVCAFYNCVTWLTPQMGAFRLVLFSSWRFYSFRDRIRIIWIIYLAVFLIERALCGWKQFIRSSVQRIQQGGLRKQSQFVFNVSICDFCRNLNCVVKQTFARVFMPIGFKVSCFSVRYLSFDFAQFVEKHWMTEESHKHIEANLWFSLVHKLGFRQQFDSAL